MNIDFFKERADLFNSGREEKFCPSCFTSVNTILAEGRAGCPECYSFFREEIRSFKMQYRELNEPVRS